VIAFLAANPGVRSIDLTGGAPELNPQFRRLVLAARERGLRVIDRCNLTILEEPDFDDLAGFLAAHRVEIVASLPCYLEENVDRQRGNGVFEASLRALRRLNTWATATKAAACAEPGLQPAGPQPAAAAGRLAGGLQAPSGRDLRRGLQRTFHPGQHADPALWQHADLQGQFNAYLTTLRGPTAMPTSTA
jgi:hypothetical protein